MWEAIEFFLAVIGALTIGKIIYDVLLEKRVERIKKKEAKEIK